MSDKTYAEEYSPQRRKELETLAQCRGSKVTNYRIAARTQLISIVDLLFVYFVLAVFMFATGAIWMFYTLVREGLM